MPNYPHWILANNIEACLEVADTLCESDTEAKQADLRHIRALIHCARIAANHLCREMSKKSEVGE